MEDPLVQTSGLDTSYPILPEAEYEFQIIESIRKPNRENSGYNWHMQLALMLPAISVDGRPINPNYPIFIDCPLQAKPDAKDPNWFRGNIGAHQDAIFGCDKSTRQDLTMNGEHGINQAVGRKVMVMVKIETNDKTGQQGNRAGKIRPVT